MRKYSALILGTLALLFTNVASAQDGTPPPPPGYTTTAPAPTVIYVAQPQVAERVPTRSGFTMELSLGVGHLRVPVADFSQFGLAGLSLSLGGFLSPDLALMFRATGVAVPEAGGTIVSVGALGVLQYWATDRLTLSGGLGLSQVSVNSAFDSTIARSNKGFAINFRIGYALAQFTHHSLGLTYEITPAWIDGESVLMQGLALNWQWH